MYATLMRTVARFRDRPAYGAPPRAGRAYHPRGIEYTWGETADAVEVLRDRYAAAGYGHGHRVAVLIENRPEFFFHYYALNALGASIVPINPEYRHDEIFYYMTHSGACLAVAINSRFADLEAVARELPQPMPVVSFEDFPNMPPPAPPALRTTAPDGHTEAALLYTSGTTGRPKGCILTNEYFHTFGNWYASCGGTIALHEGEERLYNPLPLHHANALGISSPAMLLTGGCHFVPDRFHPGSWWDDMHACGITAVHYQGVVPNLLMKQAPTANERTHKIRYGLGVGVDPTQHAAIEARFGFPLVEFWAMTETGRLMVDNHEPRQIHTRAFGRQRPGLEARVVDGHDREVPPGQPGELVIRHSAAEPRKGFFSCYLKDPVATDTAWRGGWFHTGDVVTKDESDMHYFVDRKKNIIRRSGENIAAAEVEAILAVHDKVRQVAVIAVPDELREEEVMACVIAKDKADEDEALARELFELCHARLAYFKAPGWVLYMDSFPTTSTQKIRKVSMFEAGVDPRKVPGAIDLRALKGKTRASASAS